MQVITKKNLPRNGVVETTAQQVTTGERLIRSLKGKKGFFGSGNFLCTFAMNYTALV